MRLKLSWCLGIVLPLSFLVPLSGLLVAQSSLVGPVEGFVFDPPSRGVRAVMGIVGASSFGPILVRGVDFASVAPRQDYALVVRGGEQTLVSGLGSGVPSTSSLPSTVRAPEGAVWSGDGSAAILFSRSGNWIQPVTGFPAQAAPGASTDLTALGGTLTAVAADQAGKRIAIGMGGNTGGVYFMDPNNGPAQILPMANPVGLAFSSDGLTLYAVDGASAQVAAVTLAGFASRSFPLSGLADPIALTVGPDSTGRQTVYVAGGQDRLLQSYDASTGALLASVPLGFAPSAMAVFGNATYILGSRANASQPLWSFRTSPVPVVYFIPAAPQALPEGRRK